MVKVAIEPFIGSCAATRKPVRFSQYRVRVDGLHAGLVGFHEGAKVLLSVNFSPLEIKEIEQKVAELMQVEAVSAKQYKEPPTGFYDKENEGEELDDFDS